jgi:NAD(P)H dehydrogenase (quinone)
MHVLVIFAHPSRASFTGEVLEALLAGMHTANHTVEVGDLYAEGFDPILDYRQFQRETAMDADSALPADVECEQARLDRAEGLIFLFPLWWTDMPAILKGWFDRVWSYGYAYSYSEDRSRHSRLQVRKALAVAVAGHPFEHLEETGMVEAMERVIVQDRLLGVGIPEARLEILGGLSGNPPEIRARHLLRAKEIAEMFSSKN